MTPLCPTLTYLKFVYCKDVFLVSLLLVLLRFPFVLTWVATLSSPLFVYILTKLDTLIKFNLKRVLLTFVILVAIIKTGEEIQLTGTIKRTRKTGCFTQVIHLLST